MGYEMAYPAGTVWKVFGVDEGQGERYGFDILTMKRARVILAKEGAVERLGKH